MKTSYFSSILWPLSRAGYAAVVAIACLALCGCSEDEAIRTYSVPKLQVVTQDQETIGVIIPKETPWAIKMKGQPEKVELYDEVFRQLVASLTFDEDGSPRWKLPDQWQEEAGNGITYRNLRPPGEKEFKVTVSQLKVPFDWSELDEGKWQVYMKDNVNRWRRELSLAEQNWGDITPQLEAIEKFSIPKAAAYLVRLRGKSEVTPGGKAGPMGGMGMGGAPAAPGPSGASGATGGSAPRDPKGDIKYTLPDGWREVAPLSIMAIKSIELDGPGGKKANVTFTAAGGDREANVARWNGQVRGPAEQVAKALESSQKLTIHGAPAEVVELVGSGDDPQAILAATVSWSPQDSLFIKMMGPAEAVASAREPFMQFLQSISW